MLTRAERNRWRFDWLTFDERGIEEVRAAAPLRGSSTASKEGSTLLLDLLPPKGAVIIAAPLKIKQGSGSPLRVLALLS